MISLVIYFLMFISLKIQQTVAMMQTFDMSSDDFWTALMRDEIFAGDYDADYSHDYQGAQDFDAFAYTNAETQPNWNSQQYPNRINGQYNFAYDIPNDSKEEIYVFLDKGRTRYIPMSVKDRTRIVYSGLNINGQNIRSNEAQNFQRTGWSNGQHQRANKYDYDFPQNSLNERNFHKRHNCLQNRHKNTERRRAQEYENYEDNDFLEEVMPNSHRNSAAVKRGKNVRKNNRKGFQNKGDSIISCGGKHEIEQDCVSRESKARVIATNMSAVQIKSLAAAQVVVQNSRADNRKNNRTANSQSDFSLGSTQQLDKDENDVIVGSAVQADSKPRQDHKAMNGNPPTTTQAQTDLEVVKRKESTLSTDLPLTESPIYFIKINGPNQKNKNRRRPTPKSQTDQLNEKPLSESPVEKTLALTNGGISYPNRKPSINSKDNNETANVNDEVVADNSSETDRNMENASDQKPSENRLYAYVTKLDGTAPKPVIQEKYKEPIAYETLLINPISNKNDATEKSASRLISKPKRNINFRTMSSRQIMRARRKKDQLAIKTSTTKAPVFSTTTVLTDEPEFLIRLFADPKDLNKKPERDNKTSNFETIPIEKFQTQANDKQMTIVTNVQSKPQILGSQRTFNEDYDDIEPTLCPDTEPLEYSGDDDEDDLDQMPDAWNYDKEPGGNAIELHSAERENLPPECNEETDVAYEGDRVIQKIIGTITPAPRRQSKELNLVTH